MILERKAPRGGLHKDFVHFISRVKLEFGNIGCDWTVPAVKPHARTRKRNKTRLGAGKRAARNRRANEREIRWETRERGRGSLASLSFEPSCTNQFETSTSPRAIPRGI